MILTKISIKNPVFAVMLMLAISLLGIISYMNLNVQQFPDVALPTIVVTTDYPNASPETVEAQVTKKVEDAANSISGIDNISSISYEGKSVVTIEFNLGVDADTAAADVREKVSAIKGDFNSDIKDPEVKKFSRSDTPVISLALSSTIESKSQLTTLANNVIKKRLQQINGAGSVNVLGGVDRQVVVQLLPDRLHAYKISVAQVIDAVKSENNSYSVGNISHEHHETFIKIKKGLASTESFRHIVVSRRNDTPIYLSSVANIVDAHADQQNSALYNNKSVVAIDVVKTHKANTIKLVNDVRSTINTLEKTLPKSVEIHVSKDNSLIIKESVQGVKESMLDGILLTVLIVFLFLLSWRSTIITGLTIPISILGSLSVLYLFGFTINVVSLLGLTLAVGMIIDDAIVVRENITRHVEMGKTHLQAALEGTKEIGLSVLATTLTLVAVFLPLAFMGGEAGKYFKGCAVVVTAAVLISLLVSFTLDPMLSSIWHKKENNKTDKKTLWNKFASYHERILSKSTDVYHGILVWAIKYSKTVLISTLIILLASFSLVKFLGAEFVPASDLGKVNVSIKTPEGSSLQYTQAKAKEVLTVLQNKYHNISSSYTTINTDSNVGKNYAVLYLTLNKKNAFHVSTKGMVELMRSTLQHVGGLSSISIGLPGETGEAKKSIQFSIDGDDLNVLSHLSDQITSTIKKIPGIVDVDSSLLAQKPTYILTMRQGVDSRLGITKDRLNSFLRPLFSGEDANTWQIGDNNYDVVVQLPKDKRSNLSDLNSLYITSTNHTKSGSPILVPLDQVAKIQLGKQASQINRRDLHRNILISTDLSSDLTASVAGAKIKAALAKINFPAGYHVDMQLGDAKKMSEGAKYAAITFILSVAFMYFIIASLFNSFTQPIIIMVSLPLSLIGVLFGLWVGGSTLNLFSIVGCLMLMGLVAKNAILLVDYANSLVKQGVDCVDAILQAGKSRFRPILMTSLAMIFGMLPIAMGIGAGADQRVGMGDAVIGGLISSTLLTLIVVPLLYIIFHRLKRKDH